MRNKIGTQIGWFLTAKQLKQPKDLIEPIQHTINLQPVARHRISRRDELGPLRYSPTNRFQWNLQNLNLALTVGLQTNRQTPSTSSEYRGYHDSFQTTKAKNVGNRKKTSTTQGSTKEYKK
ncbi:hypothetical protein L3Y34_000313 [Caenorhabditis briggsae]|uniref:Uncharacterized protein n=1 Tax=Caenorhabditis briggsae TaxID=6238 RepID=A0AAE9D971_CAEBR|nr:hypothetical protein L3Y34_000313 [Caenorhabditis briggsae]